MRCCASSAIVASIKSTTFASASRGCYDPKSRCLLLDSRFKDAAACLKPQPLQLAPLQITSSELEATCRSKTRFVLARQHESWHPRHTAPDSHDHRLQNIWCIYSLHRRPVAPASQASGDPRGYIYKAIYTVNQLVPESRAVYTCTRRKALCITEEFTDPAQPLGAILRPFFSTDLRRVCVHMCR